MDDETDDYTVVFRTGPRQVAPHVKAMLEDAGILTIRYTYEQAIQLANETFLGDAVYEAQNSLLQDHFKDYNS